MTNKAAGRPSIRGLLLTLAAGCALGLVNSLANALGSAYGPLNDTPGHGVRWLEYLSSWLGSSWAWALFAFLVGRVLRRPPQAAVQATLGLWGAVLTYYLGDFAIGVDEVFNVRAAGFWAVTSLVIGPVMGCLGALSRRPGWLGLAASLSMPALMAHQAVTVSTGPSHIQPWNGWAVVGGAVILAALLGLEALRKRRARRLPPASE